MSAASCARRAGSAMYWDSGMDVIAHTMLDTSSHSVKQTARHFARPCKDVLAIRCQTMIPQHETRRRNLAVLVKEAGGQAALGAKINRTRNQVWQWTLPDDDKRGRNLSDDIARELEAAMGKPIGWLDIPDVDQEREDRIADSASQPARFDQEILADALKVIEGAAQWQGAAPVISARAIAIAYALIEDSAIRVNESNIIALTKAFMSKVGEKSNESA